MSQVSSLRLPTRGVESRVWTLARCVSRGADETPSAAGSANAAVSTHYDAAKRRRVCEEEEMVVGGAGSMASFVVHDSAARVLTGSAAEEASDGEPDEVESDKGLMSNSSDESAKGHRCRYCDYRAASKSDVSKQRREAVQLSVLRLSGSGEVQCDEA